MDGIEKLLRGIGECLAGIFLALCVIALCQFVQCCHMTGM